MKRQPVLLQPLGKLGGEGGEEGGQAQLGPALAERWSGARTVLTWTRPSRKRSDQLFLISETWVE